MRDAVTAYVALGANLGHAAQVVQWAIQQLGQLPGAALIRQSGLYCTAPLDARGPDFINAVVEITTTLTAPALLGQMLAIELAAGRTRPYHHAPRTLDLDLLWFGDALMESPQLTLPHPRMLQRAFVLLPLAEIAPQRIPAAWLDLVADQTVTRLAV